MRSAPLARKYSAAARTSARTELGGVVDLGEDLDVVGAVVRRPAPPGRSTRESRADPSGPSRPERRTARSATPVSPSHSPGCSTRSVPGGHLQEPRDPRRRHERGDRDLEDGDVAPRTAARISSSTRRSAGSASLPVTNSTGGARGAATVDPRSAPTCSAFPRARRPVGRQSTTSSILRASSKSLSVIPPAAWFCSLTVSLAPRHGEIGMVIGRLGDVADRVHQHERRRPAVGLVDAADPAVLVLPARAGP